MDWLGNKQAHIYAVDNPHADSPSATIIIDDSPGSFQGCFSCASTLFLVCYPPCPCQADATSTIQTAGAVLSCHSGQSVR